MGKRAKHRGRPRTAKEARSKPTPPIKPLKDRKIEWSFVIFDKSGIWEASPQKYDFRDIAAHLKSYEQLTWADIRRRDHPVQISDLIPKAQKRLEHLGQSDIDELWRLKFTGTQRVWGIPHLDEFRVLWWDPEHSVCLSHKKHT